MKPVSTEIYPYSTYSLTCWTRLQTSVSPSIFTRSEPDWASICLHQGFSPQKLEGSVAFCYWQSLSPNYTRDGLEFFSCLWLCCLVLSNNKQFHFIMLHRSISRNKITWAAFEQLRTDKDSTNWQSQLVRGWGKVHMEEHECQGTPDLCQEWNHLEPFQQPLYEHYKTTTQTPSPENSSLG